MSSSVTKKSLTAILDNTIKVIREDNSVSAVARMEDIMLSLKVIRDMIQSRHIEDIPHLCAAIAYACSATVNEMQETETRCDA